MLLEAISIEMQFVDYYSQRAKLKHRLDLACHALELAGFTRAVAQEISTSSFIIKCQHPRVDGNHVEVAKRAITRKWVGLHGVGLQVGTPTIQGGQLLIPLRGQTEEFVSRPVGRPRNELIGERVEEVRKEGKSWNQLQRKLNKELGLDLTVGAYRYYWTSRNERDPL